MGLAGGKEFIQGFAKLYAHFQCRVEDHQEMLSIRAIDSQGRSFFKKKTVAQAGNFESVVGSSALQSGGSGKWRREDQATAGGTSVKFGKK